MTSPSEAEGYVAFPKRASLFAIVGAITLLVSQEAGLVWFVSKIDSRVSELESADRRILDRGDEHFARASARLDVLERDRDRLTRVEEKLGFAADTLKRIESKLDQR